MNEYKIVQIEQLKNNEKRYDKYTHEEFNDLFIKSLIKFQQEHQVNF